MRTYSWEVAVPLSQFEVREKGRHWVHGRSRVTSGASRLHHWLGSLKSHPGALPTSGKANGPNSPGQGCWLASGSSSSREGQISPPWATPSQWRDPPSLGSGGGGGGWDAVRRPVRLANKEEFPSQQKKIQGRESQPTGRFGFGGWRNIWSYLPTWTKKQHGKNK